MAVPKKRQSYSRTRRRRAHDALKPVALTTCKNCSELIKPHLVCQFCGYYKDKKIIMVNETV